MNIQRPVRVLIIIVSLMISKTSIAQLTQIVIGGPGNELATKVAFNPADNSTYIGGYMYNYSGGVASNCQAIVMKLNQGGAIVWQKRFGIPNTNNLIQDMIITQDGNVVVVGKVGGTSASIHADNTAAILKFSSLDGSLIWQKCFRDAATTTGGELFFEVTEMADGRLVAVGGHDFTGTNAGSMICVFQSNGTLIYNEVFDISNGDEFQGVATSASGNSVYICGEYVGNFKDGRVLKYTPGTTSGTIDWSVSMDFYLHGTQENNFLSKMHLAGGKLVVLGGSLQHYSTAGGVGMHVVTLDTATGGNITVYGIKNSGTGYANSPAIAVASADHIFTVQSPSVSDYDPVLFPTGVSSNTVVTEITSLTTQTANTPVRFNSAALGLHSLNDVKLEGSMLRLAGATTTIEGFGNNDIYFVVSHTSLASLNQNCDTVHETVSITTPTLSPSSFSHSIFSFTPVYVTVDTATTNFSITMLCGDNILQSVADVQSEDFDMYPNPAFESVTIRSKEDIRSVTITNMVGRLVYSRFFNSKKEVVDIENLPAGIYYLKVNGDRQQKFVKY